MAEAEVPAGFDLLYAVVSLQMSIAPGTRTLSNNMRWQQCIMGPGTNVQGRDPSVPVTQYSQAVHPARSVTFGGPVTCLIYPTGRVIAHGKCKVALARQHAVKAFELSQRVCESKVASTSEPRVENLVVRCPRILEVQARVDADMLWMDKTAARLGASPVPFADVGDGESARPAVVDYCPDVQPGFMGVRVPSPSHGTARPSALGMLYEDGSLTVHGVTSLASAVEAYKWVLNHVVRGELVGALQMEGTGAIGGQGEQGAATGDGRIQEGDEGDDDDDAGDIDV